MYQVLQEFSKEIKMHGGQTFFAKCLLLNQLKLERTVIIFALINGDAQSLKLIQIGHLTIYDLCFIYLVIILIEECPMNLDILRNIASTLLL